MDERSIEWLRLLPADSRFVVQGGPPGLAELLADRLGPNPNAFLGWRVGPRQLPATDSYQAVVLINPRGISRGHLRALGFGRTLSFCALPSLADPRMFAPLGNRQAAARALDFIALYRPIAKLKRALTVHLARFGQLGRVGDRVVVGRRSESELERWLSGATGLDEIHLAISPGGISHKRKVTIQVMRADGEVAGFAKVAIAPAAVEATERESDWLIELAKYPELDGVVPRLLARAPLSVGFASLLSPGPRAPAPPAFGQPHRDFLALLAAATRCQLPFAQSGMWHNLCNLLQALEPRLPREWPPRVTATFGRLRVLYGERVLALSLAHRDFQPGNMRQFPDGRLFVYDWEGAQPETTPLYDFFNFNFLNSIPEGAPRLDVVRHVLELAHTWFPHADRDALPAHLAAYLVDHALRRLTNSDFGRDARSVYVLKTIGELLDHQAEWLTTTVG